MPLPRSAELAFFSYNPCSQLGRATAEPATLDNLFQIFQLKYRRCKVTTHVLQFVALPERARRSANAPPRLSRGDRVEVHVTRLAGEEVRTPLPPEAAELVGLVLERLFRGDKVAVLTEDQEVSPNDAAAILGISRPLVVHRMEVGDLPFRYVGKHRRAKLADVLALKEKLDVQRQALAALAEDTEDLAAAHGL